MEQQVFAVSGMSCAACSARVERVVAALPGVHQVLVNLLTRSMKVSYDAKLTQADQIIAAVVKAGYGASTTIKTAPDTQSSKSLRKRFTLSLALLIPLVCLHHYSHSAHSSIAQFILLIPIVWMNRRYFISGISAVKAKAPNMDTLISLGAAASIVYSIADILWLKSGALYIDSAGMILTLITLGKWMESRATGHTGDALNKLKELMPSTATVVRKAQTSTIPVSEVQKGDILLITAGARIPVDAEVSEGCSSIDEAYLTGESMPVLKQAGSKIFAGTVNGNGLLRATALCAHNESVMSGIINLVGEASASKAPIARLADRISGIFVPVVISLSLLTALVWLLWGATPAFAMGCAISVLVISCPCALGLATPVAIMVGAGKAAEKGIIFRDAAAMEEACRTTAVVLDKTGTLTAGQPIIMDVIPSEQASEAQLLQLAKSIEQNSHHPLARAIRKLTTHYTPETAEELEYHPGRGISARIQGELCLAGNAELMRENGIAIPADTPGGMTPIYFSRAGRYWGMLLVADPLKPGSAGAVAAMQQANMKVIIMSGDNKGAVRQVADKLGISDYHAAVLPADKEAEVRRLQQSGYKVAMIGDGINDAPALTRADTGIAIGCGTDVAIESAGIILVHNELNDAVNALELSRRIMLTIRQNLFWAFFYNLLAIPLAAGLYYPLFGWLLTPGIAAAAMSMSSLFVVFNALRLRRAPLSTPQSNSMQTITISVEGMMCPHCERHVTQALSALPGISEVKADHKTSSVTLSTNSAVDEALLAATIKEAGYDFKGIR